MFNLGEFTSHSGKKLSWKIECDTLNESDLHTIHELIASKFKFSMVYSPPTHSHFVNDLVRFLKIRGMDIRVEGGLVQVFG
jgi:hypothetical protein